MLADRLRNESVMVKDVFISFRFKDGAKYKEKLAELLRGNENTVDFSEDEDRSDKSEETIQKYLYAKLRRSSVTIIIVTPDAVEHHKNEFGEYDDWMYDEIRYSLEDRGNNRTNGLVAVYTPEAKGYLVKKGDDCRIVKQFDNIFRSNMMNIKDPYKHNPNFGLYNIDYDSYCSLISWDDFISDIDKYIGIAADKRDNKEEYSIKKRL